MKRKKSVSVFASALLLLSLLLSACGPAPQEPEPAPSPEPVPVTITEYVNTTEAFGNTEHSRIRIGDDGSFVLLDNYSAGTNELTGTWTLEDGIYTLSVETAKMGNYRTILFEMKDGQTLILKTDLTGSKAGQTFSSDPDAEMVSLNSEDDFPYGKYDNTSSVGAFRSYIMIYPKGTFSYADTDNVNTEVISGTYVRSADRLTCSYTSGGSQKTFDLQIRDDGDLVLLNDVGKSGTGNIFSMNANTGDSSKVIPCYGIVFNNHRPNVFDDDPGWNIGAEALPENTTDTMVYSTGDPSVLVIDQQGNITVKGTGSTYVKVVCGEEETMAYVQVAKNGPTSVLFNPGAGRLDLGFGMQLKAIVIPESGSQKVTYWSEDPSIASVSADGYVKGLFPGVTRIFAAAPNGVEGYYNLYVNGETVTWDMTDVTIDSGGVVALQVRAYHIANYDNWYNKADLRPEIEFHSSNPGMLWCNSQLFMYAGSVSQRTPVSFWFTWSDGSSLSSTSPTYTAYIVP